jgi:hypothetical protein
MSENGIKAVVGRGNAWSTDDQNTEFVKEALLSALNALKGCDGVELPLDAFSKLLEAAEALNQIDRYLPMIKAYCVVKHYVHASPSGWAPAVWLGFTTEAQANAFRNVIATYYDSEAKRHDWQRDEWRVELRPCHIRQMVKPSALSSEWSAWR